MNNREIKALRKGSRESEFGIDRLSQKAYKNKKKYKRNGKERNIWLRGLQDDEYFDNFVMH